jgi:ankyrin repeat protein
MAVVLCVCGGESDSQDGDTALIYAADDGHADCVRLLIDAGADKEAKNNVRRRSLLCRGSILFIYFPLPCHFSYSSPPDCVFLFVITHLRFCKLVRDIDLFASVNFAYTH